MNENEAIAMLNEMGVTWKGYVPPGGTLWGLKWKQEFRPSIVKYLESAKADYERLRDQERGMKTLLENVASMRKTARESLSLANEMPARDLELSLLDIHALVAEAEYHFKDHYKEAVAHIQKEREIVYADIRYMEAVLAYLDTDIVVDRLSYALDTVNEKFRAKLIRLIVKMLPTIESARMEIKISSAKMKEILGPMLEKILSTLDESYDYLTPCYRNMKKTLDKTGVAELSREMFTRKQAIATMRATPVMLAKNQ